MENMATKYSEAKTKRVAAGVCGILLGAFGVHKFILGYYFAGFFTLFLTILAFIFTCGILSPVIHMVGLIEGILYLVKSDEEFYKTHIERRRPWF
jgi:TM2 domain-containing membrane protein YozV